jgi:hypothetical protein
MGDIEVVLLNHHDMAIAVDALILQAHEVGLGAGLSEVLRRTMTVYRLKGGFGCQ